MEDQWLLKDAAKSLSIAIIKQAFSDLNSYAAERRRALKFINSQDFEFWTGFLDDIDLEKFREVAKQTRPKKKIS